MGPTWEFSDGWSDHLAPADHLTLHLASCGNLKFLLIDSYSESSGRSSGQSHGTCRSPCICRSPYIAPADLPPTPLNWHFEIPTDRFLLWELRQIMWQIYPPGPGILSLGGELNWVQLTWAQMGSDHLAPADHLTLHLQIYHQPLKMAIWNSYFYSES